jgi:hypothetical protein
MTKPRKVWISVVFELQLFFASASYYHLVSMALILFILSMANEQAAVTPGKLYIAKVVSKQSDLHDFSPSSFFAPFSRELMPLGKRISTRQVISGVMLSTEVIHAAAGPDLVYILKVDLTNPNIRLGVVQAYNRLISPDSTLTSMAKSTGAVAGINGDYFEIHGSGVPIGEEVINGHLLHSPNPHFLAVLGVTSAGRLTIGPEVFTGSVVDGKASHTLFSLNHYSEWNNGRLLLFTPDLGEPVYVGGDPVAIIKRIADSPGMYIVKSVLSSVTHLPALSKQDALLGGGEAGEWVARTLHVGDHIRITTRISPDPNLFQAIGGGPVVVKNGALFYDPHPPAPGEVYQHNALTAVGVSRDGTHAFLVVFDGSPSDPVRSRGLTYFEAAHFMLALGCYNAMLLDSGRSSEMVVRFSGHRSVSIINRPSGGSESPLANGFFIYSNG